MITPRSMKRITLVVFLVLITFLLPAQKMKDLGAKPVWVDGVIVLKDKTRLEGKIYYNTSFGTVQFKDDGEVLSIQENRVLEIRYFDPTLNRLRNYSSFVYAERETGQDQELLFEIIKDFESFAVLSRISKPLLFLPSNTDPGMLGEVNDFIKKKTLIEIEGIFFLGNDNELQLYCLIKNTEVDGLFRDYSKADSKVLKSKIPETFMEEHWEDIKAYIRQARLDPSKKDDLIRILDHYEQLVAQSK